jgi:hypothetical protein
MLVIVDGSSLTYTEYIEHAGGSSLTDWLEGNLLTKCKQITKDSTVQEYVNTTKTDCYWAHVYPEFTIPQLQKILRPTQLKVSYLMGHYPFGMCTLATQDCKYVTILREPVARLISHYRYMRRVHPDVLASYCQVHTCDTLQQYVHGLWSGKIDDYDADNVQTRMLSGDAFGAHMGKNCTLEENEQAAMACFGMPLRGVTRGMTQNAIANLRNHFSVVGTTEQFEKFAYNLSKRYGFTLKHIERINAAPMPMDDVDPETMLMMREYLRHDIRVYKAAHALDIH